MQIPKQQYTSEFKKLAVKRVKDGLTAGPRLKFYWPRVNELVPEGLPDLFRPTIRVQLRVGTVLAERDRTA